MVKFSKDSKENPTRFKLMEAASELFQKKGYAATTTKAIAEMAGVNEVTLFRHFGTKEQLAKAIMDQYGGAAISTNIEDRLSGNLKQDLIMLGTVFLKVMTERRDAIKMALCESGRFPEFREVVVENPRQLRLMLARYFNRQIKAGEIESGHTELMAQAFLGFFFSNTVLEGFFQDSLHPQITADDLVEQYVSFFIEGIRKKED